MAEAPNPPLQIFFKEIKFEHSLFALPFAYLGLFLAEEGRPHFFVFFWVTVAMVGFRTFAMAMNRLVDRKIDAQNPRTSSRALPQKKLQPRFVGISAFFALIVFLGSVRMLGPLCLLLSPIPIVLAVLYPYLKRFTWLSHLCLGIILGLSPYGAWLAARGEFSWIPGLLLIGVTSWVAGFDILYSLQDLEFDRSAGLHSFPVRFGKPSALIIAGLLHAAALLAWAGVGELAGLGWFYRFGLIGAAFFLLREHWLIRRFGLAKIEQAFFTMNVGVSFALLIAAVMGLYWR